MAIFCEAGKKECSLKNKRFTPVHYFEQPDRREYRSRYQPKILEFEER